MLKKILTLHALIITMFLIELNIQAINEKSMLNWIKVTQTELSTQLMFDFSQSIHSDKHVDLDNNQLNVTFSNISINAADAHNVIDELKKTAIIKAVTLHTPQENSNTVELSITFHSLNNSRELEDNAHKKNRLVIKWSTFDDPNRIIIDIFSRSALKKIKKKNAILLYSENTPDKKNSPKKLRIMLDTGYAKKSKTVLMAQKISQKTQKFLLNKQHCNVVLAERSDTCLSSLEQIELAHQLNVDLYVNLHLSSTIISDKKLAHLLYADNNFYTKEEKTGFFFPYKT